MTTDILAASSEPREIAPGVWWLANCLVLPLSGEVMHLHNAPYLIMGSTKTLLWDTGAPLQWDSIEPSIEAVLGARPLDYLVPSHSEVPHGGNISRLMAKYPEAQLVGDVRDYPLFFPEFRSRMVTAPAGTTLELGGHTLTLLDAVVKDVTSSQWAYEASQQVLFVGDGFAYSHRAPYEGDDRPVHLAGQCTLFASELSRPPEADQIVWITKAALYWTHFVHLDLLRGAMSRVLREYPTRLVAPSHGAVIDDMQILWTVWEALCLAYNPDLGIVHAGADVFTA